MSLPTLIVPDDKGVLPISKVINWLKDHLREFTSGLKAPETFDDRVLIVEAETGSGKSTVMPVEIFRLFRGTTGVPTTKYLGSSILCTQPRVLTSIQIVLDVSGIYPDMVKGKTVGYQNGVVVHKPRKGLIFATIGVLVMQLKTIFNEINEARSKIKEAEHTETGMFATTSMSPVDMKYKPVVDMAGYVPPEPKIDELVSSLSRETSDSEPNIGEMASAALLAGEKLGELYRVIIIDEAHERSIDLDITLFMLKKMYSYVLKYGSEDQRHKLPIIMLASATLDLAAYAGYFDLNIKTNSIKIPGRSFPITPHWLKVDSTDVVQTIAGIVEEIHTKSGKDDEQMKGDIIIFSPSSKTNDAIISALAGVNKKIVGILPTTIKNSRLVDSTATVGKGDDDGKPRGLMIFGLSSDDVRDETPSYRAVEIRADDPRFKGQRRIFVATNVAETGLTIPSIRYVLDTGWVNEKVNFPGVGISSLSANPVTQSRMKQRSGRAGRKFPGDFYPIYDKSTADLFLENQYPEVVKAGIDRLMMTVAEFTTTYKAIDAYKTDDKTKIEGFNLKDIDLLGGYPPSDCVHSSIEKAERFGFLSYPKYELTLMGKYAMRMEGLYMEEIRAILEALTLPICPIDVINCVAAFSLDMSTHFYNSKLIDFCIGAAPDWIFRSDMRITPPKWFTYGKGEAISPIYGKDASDYTVKTGTFMSDVGSPSPTESSKDYRKGEYYEFNVANAVTFTDLLPNVHEVGGSKMVGNVPYDKEETHIGGSDRMIKEVAFKEKGIGDFYVGMTEENKRFFKFKLLTFDQFIEMALACNKIVELITTFNGDYDKIKSFAESMEITIDNIYAYMARREVIINSLLSAGINPFINHTETLFPAHPENFISRVKLIKRCIYNALKLNLLTWNDKKLCYQSRHGFDVALKNPMFVAADFHRVDLTDVTPGEKEKFELIFSPPKYLVTNKMTYMNGEITADLVSVMDGYVAVDL